MKFAAALLLAIAVAGCGAVDGKAVGASCRSSSECADGLVCDTLTDKCAENITLRRDAAVVDANMVDDAEVMDVRPIDVRIIDAPSIDARD